jgi:pimeloyl-ACP methyl ester carboxylesterase
MSLREITLPQGTIDVRDEGEGPPIVFIHGLLVDGRLWDDTAAELRAQGARTIQPDLPLGCHRHPMKPDADLSPHGLARLIADLLEALDLRDVTLVGNDTGGALCQLVVTRHPERIGRLVLTPCDAFDDFPPKFFWPLQYVGGYVPGAPGLLAASLRSKAALNSPLAFGWLAKRKRTDLYVEWVTRTRASKGARRDVAKVLRGIRPRYTREAARLLPGFDRPTLIVWASEDRFFKPKHANALAALLPDARVEMIDDSYTFVSLDRPAELARLVAGFSGLGGSSASDAPPATSSSAAPATSK